MAKAKKTQAPAKPKAAPKGGKSRGKRKLTDAQVLEIVERYNDNGVKAAQLAREYGVSHPTISAIVKGRTYVWLTKIGMPAPEPELAEAA
jgi:hypothetical protein